LKSTSRPSLQLCGMASCATPIRIYIPKHRRYILAKKPAGIPSLIEASARKAEWILRNRIIWVKEGGMPDPVRDRLRAGMSISCTSRLTVTTMICLGMLNVTVLIKRELNPGDVWKIAPSGVWEIISRPFLVRSPNAPLHWLARRLYAPSVVTLADALWSARRNWTLPAHRRGGLWRSLGEKKLTPEHIAAIQATGISDAGKARLVQNGTE